MRDDHETTITTDDTDHDAPSVLARRVLDWLKDGALPGALDAANDWDEDSPTWVQ